MGKSVAFFLVTIRIYWESSTLACPKKLTASNTKGSLNDDASTEDCPAFTGNGRDCRLLWQRNPDTPNPI